MSRRHAEIVFVCPGRYSVGELYNAIVMSRSLQAAGMTTTFIVTEQLAGYASASGADIVVRSLRRGRGPEAVATVEQLNADLAIVADYHLPFLEPGAADIQSLISHRVPTVMLDSLGFGLRGAEVSNSLASLPAAEALHRWFSPTTHIPRAVDPDALLHPVPVGAPHAPNAFALYDSIPGVRARATTVRERYGIATGRALVVVAQSAWAATGFTQLGRSRRHQLSRSYDDLRTDWILHCLSLVGVPVTVVGVRREQAARSQYPNVSLVHTPFLGLDDFSDLLTAADLYLTDNLLSAAMARAAMIGTPCLALVHEAQTVAEPTTEFEASWHAQMTALFPGYDFPYLVNPFGWISEVGAMMPGNPYLQAVPRVDVFDAQAVAHAVRLQLSSPDQGPTAVLRDRSTARASPAEVVHRALSRFSSDSTRSSTPSRKGHTDNAAHDDTA
jgi:CheY-like chemotaxis protein